MRCSVILVAAAVLLAGCGKAGESPESKQSGGSSVIDTMTQKNKVDAGRRAGEQLRKISAQESSDRQEVGAE